MSSPNEGVVAPPQPLVVAHHAEDGCSKKKKFGGGAVRYMECLKNHAAGIGGSATDGCGEFLAGGEEGTLEALKCCACNCHRNFHRKIDVSADVPAAAEVLVRMDYDMEVRRRKAEEAAVDEGMLRKRFRSKFSQEQKEKMQRFAEKCGWKMQKAGDAEVRSFCEEIGVKRKVLKVWMHNNKYHFADNTNTNTNNNNNNPNPNSPIAI